MDEEENKKVITHCSGCSKKITVEKWELDHTMVYCADCEDSFIIPE